MRPGKFSARVGQDVIGNSDGAEQILEISRERFAPDAVDSVSRDVAKFMYFKLSGQIMGTYLLEFDMLRQKAG